MSHINPYYSHSSYHSSWESPASTTPNVPSHQGTQNPSYSPQKDPSSASYFQAIPTTSTSEEPSTAQALQTGLGSQNDYFLYDLPDVPTLEPFIPAHTSRVVQRTCELINDGVKNKTYHIDEGFFIDIYANVQSSRIHHKRNFKFTDKNKNLINNMKTILQTEIFLPHELSYLLKFHEDDLNLPLESLIKNNKYLFYLIQENFFSAKEISQILHGQTNFVDFAITAIVAQKENLHQLAQKIPATCISSMLYNARDKIGDAIVALAEKNKILIEFIEKKFFSAEDLAILIHGHTRNIGDMIESLKSYKNDFHQLMESQNFSATDLSKMLEKITSPRKTVAAFTKEKGDLIAFLHKKIFSATQIAEILSSARNKINTAIKELISKTEVLQKLLDEKIFSQEQLALIFKGRGCFIGSTIDIFVKRKDDLIKAGYSPEEITQRLSNQEKYIDYIINTLIKDRKESHLHKKFKSE